MPSVIGQDTSASGFDPGLASPVVTLGVWGDSGSGTGVGGTSAQRTGVEGMDVCWQVTGVRRDAWARAHPLVVKEDKGPRETGAIRASPGTRATGQARPCV